MKSLLTGLGLGLALLIGWLFLLSSGQPNTSTPEPWLETPPVGLSQRVEAPDLAGPFSFAGQPIPVSDFDVRERLDIELMRNAFFHRNTLLMLKRQTRYFPVIERILLEEGVPDDFKYLAVAESNLENATSVSGAKGFWQFMSPTGRAFGLEINNEIDERFHLEKATRAACTYLKDYYRQFGDWHFVAAAYNMGGPNLKKWIDRQRADTFFELDINQQTMQYLFRIVALKTIMENPEAFGYQLAPEDTYPPLAGYRTVTVDSSIANLGDFAKRQGTTYRKLKIYNPWLISGSLTVRGGKSYELNIPD